MYLPWQMGCPSEVTVAYDPVGQKYSEKLYNASFNSIYRNGDLCGFAWLKNLL